MKNILIIIISILSLSTNAQYLAKWIASDDTLNFRINDDTIVGVDTFGIFYKNPVIEDLESNYLVPKSYIDNLISREFQREAFSIYVDAINGNDTTGDGTDINPVQTLIGAAKLFPKNLQGASVSIYTSGGEYFWKYEFDSIISTVTYNNSSPIFIYGDTTVIESGVSFVEDALWSKRYIGTVSGTYLKDELFGYHVGDGGGRFYPITYNEAGTGDIRIDFARPNKTKSMDISVNSSRIWLEDRDVMDIDLIGSPDINFRSVDIISSGADIRFRVNKSRVWFDWGTRIFTTRMFYGGTSNASKFTTTWRGAAIISSGNRAIENVNSNVRWYISSCLISTKEALVNQGAIQFIGGELAMFSSYFRGNGSNYAISTGLSSFFSCQDDVTFKDYAFVLDHIFPGGKIQFHKGNNPCRVQLDSVLYFIGTEGTFSGNEFPNDYTVWVDSLRTDAKYNKFIELNTIGKAIPYISQELGLNMTYRGLFPEYGEGVNITLTDNATTTINIGHRDQNSIIEVSYTAIRNNSTEKGSVSIKNDGTTLTTIEETPIFDDIGLSFTASTYSGDIILLNPTLTSTGNDAIINYTVERTMNY